MSVRRWSTGPDYSATYIYPCPAMSRLSIPMGPDLESADRKVLIQQAAYVAFMRDRWRAIGGWGLSPSAYVLADLWYGQSTDNPATLADLERARGKYPDHTLLRLLAEDVS